MSIPYIRLCKKCCEELVVSTGDIGVTCQHCGAENMVDWVPKICLGEVSR